MFAKIIIISLIQSIIDKISLITSILFRYFIANLLQLWAKYFYIYIKYKEKQSFCCFFEEKALTLHFDFWNVNNIIKIVAQNINGKLPLECTDISEVRNEIDNIDKEIIRLLATRFEYVKEVVKYKDGTAKGIEAADRKAAVFRTRREWAEQNGLNPDVIEDIYTKLVQYFIEEEKKLIK